MKRMSSVPYLAALVIGLTISVYLQYVWQYFYPSIPVFFGQSPGIWASALTIAISAPLWLLCEQRPAKGPWAITFFALLLTGWLVHFALLLKHHDPYDYTVFFYPVIVAMLAMRVPNAADMRAVLNVFGWSVAALLVWTRLSELAGLIPMAPVPAELVSFEVREYWLPLAGWLGPEGRWPGPLSGTAFTGMAGAILLVLAVVIRRKSSWVFAIVGILALLLTSSRGAFAAGACGVAIAVLFSDAAIVRRVPFGARLAVGAVGAVSVLLVLLKASPNLTGRTEFWPDFIHLWQSSPWTGVGATGYLQGTNWTITAGSAHNLYIDSLARNGVLGLLIDLLALAVMAALAIRAARHKLGGPLALITTFIVLGIANTPITWVNPSLLWLALVLPALWALADTDQSHRTRNSGLIGSHSSAEKSPDEIAEATTSNESA